MAKDPAFLFYPNDWLGGTMGMTFEEKGAYLELLMLQFNRGHMTKDMIGQTVGQLWVNIQDKFKVDLNGLYYNERLDIEKEKRKTFTESRRNNVLGNNQYSKKEGHKGGHMTSHMEDVNRNVNDIVIKKEKKVKTFVAPELSEFINYFLDNGYGQELAQKAHEGYRVADWKDSKGNKVLNWKQKCQHVWFKESNKEKSSGGSLTDHYLSVGNQLGFNNTIDHE